MAERRSTVNSVTQSPYKQNYARTAGQGGAPVRYPGAPRGGNPYGMPYPQRPAQRGPVASAPKQQGKKRSRRERDYFFVMRKGVCFLMFVVSILMIAVMALSFLNVMPQFTSMYVKPDLTPLDEREPVETGEKDENGDPITDDYTDKSEYIGISDPIYGVIGALTGKNEEDVSAEAAENTDADVPSEGTTEGGDAAEEEEKPKSPFYDDISAKLDAMTGEEASEAAQQDGMLTIATYLFKYGPFGYVLTLAVLLIVALKAFFGMFGRRIFRGFGLGAFIVLICGVVTVLSGLVASGVIQGQPMLDENGVLISVMDFGGLMDFITQTFATYPATAADLETTVFLTFKLGYGSIIMLAAPVVLLLLSFFAKRKVPYSIFDR